MLLRLTAAMMLAGLAACGEQPSASNEPATIPQATAPASAPEAVGATIPAAYRGEWSADPTHCGDGAGDTRLRVAADSLRFHESIGAVESVRPSGANAIDVGASYEGEGERWTAETHLALSPDGTELTATREGATMVRRRCAG